MKKHVFAFMALSFLLSGCAVHTTESTEVGVRVNMLTGVLEEKVYPPGGTYFFAPFITDWYTFSTEARRLTMLADPKSGDRQGKDDLEFKTRDGNDVGVDVTVIYRTVPEKAPFILRWVAKDDQGLKERIIRPMARSMIRDVLNGLSSEDIYAGRKFQAADNARKVLDGALQYFGVRCDNVILGDHRFHQRYQQAINDRKVYDQQVNTNRSAAENSRGEWEAKLESTRGDVERMVAAEKGKAQQSTLEADAWFVSRQKEAEAILSERRARAEGVRKMNEALSGAGGRVMVKRKIAEKLKGKRIVVLPGGGSSDVGVQKLDVNELLRAYGIVEASGSTPATTPPAGKGQ